MLRAFPSQDKVIHLQPFLNQQKIMTHPEIVWCAIAGVLLCAFVLRFAVRFISDFRQGCFRHCHSGKRILEIGRETEMFYLPGDVDDDSDDM